MSETKPEIIICLGSSCYARGNVNIVKVVEEYLQRNSYCDEVDLRVAGSLCCGLCGSGPNITINGTVHCEVDSGVMLDILKQILPERESQ
ncbi:MAG: (2Fe-2S) ferredoxin domain-containing protein [Planctomycetaceae bacterium]|jgi:NADH:ubiquinone oxidoreductase subunit E|nr:(2Fe-2S) ferredoxin domain-containing protein [Planctomycetaceae bacterium]